MLPCAWLALVVGHAPEGSRRRGFAIPGREADMVLIAPDTTRADLELCAQHLADRARMLSRQGKRGTESAAYARLHEDIDAILTAIEAACDSR